MLRDSALIFLRKEDSEMDELLYTIADIQRIFKISRPTASKLVHSEGFPHAGGGRKKGPDPGSCFG